MKKTEILKENGLNLYVNGALMKASHQHWDLSILMNLLSAYLGVEKAINKKQVSKGYLNFLEIRARKDGQAKFILPVKLRYDFNGLLNFDFEIIIETDEFSKTKKSVENGRGCSLFFNGKAIGQYETFVELFKSMQQLLKVVSLDKDNPLKFPQGSAIALYKELIRNGSLTIPNLEHGFFFTITKS